MIKAKYTDLLHLEIFQNVELAHEYAIHKCTLYKLHAFIKKNLYYIHFSIFMLCTVVADKLDVVVYQLNLLSLSNVDHHHVEVILNFGHFLQHLAELLWFANFLKPKIHIFVG